MKEGLNENMRGKVTESALHDIQLCAKRKDSDQEFLLREQEKNRAFLLPQIDI